MDMVLSSRRTLAFPTTSKAAVVALILVWRSATLKSQVRAIVAARETHARDSVREVLTVQRLSLFSRHTGSYRGEDIQDPLGFDDTEVIRDTRI